jgi:hypothetical protein
MAKRKIRLECHLGHEAFTIIDTSNATILDSVATPLQPKMDAHVKYAAISDDQVFEVHYWPNSGWCFI